MATVNATRMELTRLKGKLITATRGHKLLKDKRDELMREFLDLVRKNKALREKVEEDLKNANKNFVIARSTMSDETVRVAFMAPKQELTVEVSTRNVMSVNIPQFETKTRTSDEGDIYSYGFAFTSSDLDTAVLSLSNIQKDLITLAEVEKSCSLMAAEIEKTRRRVNALEYVMIPTLQANIKMITMKLDENERSTQIRLMKVKDMMLEEKHHYKEVLHGGSSLCEGILGRKCCDGNQETSDAFATSLCHVLSRQRSTLHHRSSGVELCSDSKGDACLRRLFLAAYLRELLV